MCHHPAEVPRSGSERAPARRSGPQFRRRPLRLTLRLLPAHHDNGSHTPPAQPQPQPLLTDTTSVRHPSVRPSISPGSPPGSSIHVSRQASDTPHLARRAPVPPLPARPLLHVPSLSRLVAGGAVVVVVIAIRGGSCSPPPPGFQQHHPLRCRRSSRSRCDLPVDQWCPQGEAVSRPTLLLPGCRGPQGSGRRRPRRCARRRSRGA